MEKHTTPEDRLRTAMRDAGANASDLARACDVSPAAAHKWVKGGKMSADNLATAAKFLKVNEEWLRTGKLPRERGQADLQDREIDETIALLEDLRAPLAALATAIEKLSRHREASKKKRA